MAAMSLVRDVCRADQIIDHHQPAIVALILAAIVFAGTLLWARAASEHTVRNRSATMASDPINRSWQPRFDLC